MERPAKRVRQACDPCRRKKSRCPGERPVCSYCARLGQECTYTDDAGPTRHSISTNSVTSPSPKHVQRPFPNSHAADDTQSNTAARLNIVETQLAEVLSAMNQQRQEPSSHTPVRSTPNIPRQLLQQDNDEDAVEDLPVSLVPNIIQLYLEYCHCQPLPLFASSDFASNFTFQDKELKLAVAALALRFDLSLSRKEQINGVRSFSSSASRLVMQRIATETIEISTLQTLCLLTLVDFYNSNTQRASIHISLAADLSQSSGLSWSCTTPPDNAVHEAQMRCFWSITLLVRMHANLLGPFSLSIDTHSLSAYPKSASKPPLTNGISPSFDQDSRQSSEQRDLGINAYVIQLSEVWMRVAQYTRRRRQPEVHPPWSTKSEYAKILAKQMERETLMPYSKHRYRPANFAERTADELHEHREYWSPWLLNQMMYHGIICLLNHPLLLSLRLRNFRVATISEIWLQHTDDLVSSHTNWVVHLIELTETKGFLVTDPFLAHIAAIVATIYLQQSFVEDVEIQQNKRKGYLTCLSFCRQLGKQWPYIDELATKLETLETIVSTSYQNSAASNTRDKVYIDLSTFWEILESSLISEDQDQHGLKFGSTLTPRYHASGTAEEVNAHPLPEPSRLNSVSTPSNADNRRLPEYNQQARTNLVQPDVLGLGNDDFAVLAQSYFAQGQDFVGGLDDWWSLGQP